MHTRRRTHTEREKGQKTFVSSRNWISPCHFVVGWFLNVSVHSARKSMHTQRTLAHTHTQRLGFILSNQTQLDDSDNRGKIQTCTGDDLNYGVIASSAVERYTEKERYGATVGEQRQKERWDDSGRQSQTQRGSGSKRQEGKRRRQREVTVARAVKMKGHVQEGTLRILLWLKVSVCLLASCVCVCVFESYAVCVWGVYICVCVVSCLNFNLPGFKQFELTEVCRMD